MFRLTWLVGMLCSGLLVGCGEDAPCCTSESPGPDQGLGILLEVGFGDAANFMVADGTGTATAVMGPQGGYHVDMGLRVRGVSQSDLDRGCWTIDYAFRSAGGVTLSEPFTRVLTAATVSFDGVGQVRDGDRVFFAPSVNASVHSSTTITLEVRLTKGSSSVVDTAEVMLVVP